MNINSNLETSKQLVEISLAETRAQSTNKATHNSVSFTSTAFFGIKCSRPMTDIYTNCDRYYKSGQQTSEATVKAKSDQCCAIRRSPAMSLIGLPRYSDPNPDQCHSFCLHLTNISTGQSITTDFISHSGGGNGRDTFASGQELNYCLQYVLDSMYTDSDDNC